MSEETKVPTTQAQPAGTEQPKETKSPFLSNMKSLHETGQMKPAGTPPVKETVTTQDKPAETPAQPVEKKETTTAVTSATPPPTETPKKFLGKFDTEEEAQKHLERLEKKQKDLEEQNDTLMKAFPTIPIATSNLQVQSQASISQANPPSKTGVDPQIQEKINKITEWTPEEIQKYNNPDTYHDAVVEHERRVNLEMVSLQQEIANQQVSKSRQAEQEQQQRAVQAKKQMDTFFETHEDYKFLNTPEGIEALNMVAPLALQGLSSADAALILGNPQQGIPPNPNRLLEHVSKFLIERVSKLIPASKEPPVTPPPVQKPNKVIDGGGRGGEAPKANPLQKQVMGVINVADAGFRR